MKIKNIKASAFLQNLTKAYTEGIYADTPANRKLGRVGMTYAQYAQKQQGNQQSQNNQEQKSQFQQQEKKEEKKSLNWKEAAEKQFFNIVKNALSPLNEGGTINDEDVQHIVDEAGLNVEFDKETGKFEVSVEPGVRGGLERLAEEVNLTFGYGGQDGLDKDLEDYLNKNFSKKVESKKKTVEEGENSDVYQLFKDYSKDANLERMAKLLSGYGDYEEVLNSLKKKGIKYELKGYSPKFMNYNSLGEEYDKTNPLHAPYTGYADPRSTIYSDGKGNYYFIAEKNSGGSYLKKLKNEQAPEIIDSLLQSPDFIKSYGFDKPLPGKSILGGKTINEIYNTVKDSYVGYTEFEDLMNTVENVRYNEEINSVLDFVSKNFKEIKDNDTDSYTKDYQINPSLSMTIGYKNHNGKRGRFTVMLYDKEDKSTFKTRYLMNNIVKEFNKQIEAKDWNKGHPNKLSKEIFNVLDKVLKHIKENSNDKAFRSSEGTEELVKKYFNNNSTVVKQNPFKS